MCCLVSSCNDISTLPDKPVETSEASEPTEEKPQPKALKRGKITEIPVGNVYQLIQSKAALIYDVRPTLFYKMGHIPNAISFPKDDFDRAFSKHEPNILAANKNNTPVIVYCTDAACPDALIVADKLAARGHDISLLRGGYDSWKKATR